MSDPEHQVVVSAEQQQHAEDLGEELPATLPVLPLKETVVFPESMTPLAIGQERSIALIDDVVGGDRLLALVAVKNDAETPGWDDLYEIGTAAVVHKMIRVPDGTLRVLVQGIRRVRLERRVRDEPYFVGEFAEQPDVLEETKAVEALTRNVQALFARVIGLVPYLPEELQIAAANVDDPSALCHLVASTLRLKTDEKQTLLELVNVEARLRKVSLILNRELEVFELGTKIQSQVQSELEKGQREFFLRQQLKAIQGELGESDPEQAELAELRERLEALDLPEDIAKAAFRELGRLERLPSAAAEYGVIRTYLDWIVTLPWDVKTTDNLDLVRAREILDADHYDLEKVKERIIEHLAVSKLRNDPSGQILCFVGPPGVGKTSLGQSIARTLERKYARISVGGVRDEAEIRGHRRTYIGAMPGSIIRALRDAESINPVLLVDEIDKMGSDVRGDPSAAMLEVLDPEQNKGVPRPLSRPAVRPVEGALHLHGEHDRHGPERAARPHGRDPALRLHRRREARDRQAVSRAEADRGARADARAVHDLGQIAAARDPRVHARGRRARARTAHRRSLPQGGAQGRGGLHRQDSRRPATRARRARAAALLRRGAAAHRGCGRRHRARVHRRRRRHPLHRSAGVPRQGQADDHGPARRGHAGVRAGCALVGALPHGGARDPRDVVRRARRPRARPRRRGAEGRAVRRRGDGDGDRVDRARVRRSPRTSA